MTVSKEKEPSSSAPETLISPVTEIPEKVKVRKEVETWLEKVEKTTTTLPKTVTDDQTGQPLVSPADPQTPQITLPLTKQQIATGAKKKIDQALRWLSEWCLRIIKIKQAKVSFKKQKNDSDQ